MNYLDFNKSLQLFSNNYFSCEYYFIPFSPVVVISPLFPIAVNLRS